jgi:hypothetical protein
MTMASLPLLAPEFPVAASVFTAIGVPDAAKMDFKGHVPPGGAFQSWDARLGLMGSAGKP